MRGKFGPVKARLEQVLLCLLLAVFLGSAVLVNPAAAFRFVFLADSRLSHKKDSLQMDYEDQRIKPEKQQHPTKGKGQRPHTKGLAAPAQEHPYNRQALKDLLHEAKKHHPDFVVFGGDMARWGGKKNLEDWLQFMRHELGGIKLYPVKGNHEIWGHKSIKELNHEYHGVFGRSNYTFLHGQGASKTLFAVVDTHEDHNKRDRAHLSHGQMKWLSGHLQHPGAPHVIVIGHAPVEPLHHREFDAKSMGELGALLKNPHHKVALYLCGHDHYYNEKKLHGSQVSQIICGNAGAEPSRDWCFLVVDVTDKGVHFTGYKGRHGKYHKAH